MTVTLNPFEGDQTALVPIGTAYSVTLGKMLDAGNTVDDSYTVLPYIRAANIQDDGLRLADVNEMPFSEDEAARLDLRRGDLLVVEGGAVGTTTVVDHDMPGWSFQKTVNRVRPISDWSTRYLSYVLRAYRDAGVIDLVCNGSTIPHLTAEKLRALRIPSARPAEQRAIADYLDRETARIDTLIEEQRRLIEMLRERRRSVVDRAIGGLDGDACRPTNDPWWPELPDGWALLTLRRVIRALADGPHFSPNYVDDGVMFLSARNIKVDGWSLDDAKFVSKDDYLEFSKRVVPEPGDVLYTKGGTTGIARAVDLDIPFQVWVHVAVLKVRHDVVDPFFLAYALNSTPCYDQSQLFTRGATNNDLGLTRMVNIVLPVPPIEEQRRVVANLDQQTAKIDTLIAETERFIELARERRAALITAVVTGQIDVREMA